MTNHSTDQPDRRHPDLQTGACLYCHAHLDPQAREVTNRAVGAFLTTDLVGELEASLVEDWTGDQIDAAPASASQLHPACLTMAMAAAV